MSYNYETEKPWLFTDEGQRALLKVRDQVHAAFESHGAIRFDKIDFGSGSSFHFLAIMDRLEELGEVEKWGQAQLVAICNLRIAQEAQPMMLTELAKPREKERG